jgi:hypothetical protein
MTNTSLGVGLISDGNPPEVWVAQVTHSIESGRHIFTSETISGLLIIEEDAKVALAQVVPTIKRLIWHNKKQNVTVKLGKDFKEFEKTHCVQGVLQPQGTMFAVIERTAA